ncbi:MAG: hypothetical protein GX548_06375 [Lentisphaerae bacterium]|nr:hypothetical protein [Lentisphaerota bacterium]
MEKFPPFFPHHGKRSAHFSTPWKTRISSWLLNSAFCLLAASGPQALAQLGPYPVKTPQAIFNAELIKRDKNTVWIRRQASDGRYMPQVGIAVSDILAVRMPRPGLFDAVDRLHAAPNATDAQFQSAHRALDRFILQSRPFRDIPGILADEALLLKGRLHIRKEEWRDAIRQFENILLYGQPSTLTTNAQILAGIAYMKVGETQFAAEYLVDMPLPEEDEALLSAQLFALGDAYLALGNIDNALMSYLKLVVFYPFVQDNEPRALAATLDCYARLQEWEPLYRTIQEIKKTYPGTPAEKVADDMIEEYREELAKAGQFFDGDPVVAPGDKPGQPQTEPEP